MCACVCMARVEQCILRLEYFRAKINIRLSWQYTKYNYEEFFSVLGIKNATVIAAITITYFSRVLE